MYGMKTMTAEGHPRGKKSEPTLLTTLCAPAQDWLYPEKQESFFYNLPKGRVWSSSVHDYMLYSFILLSSIYFCPQWLIVPPTFYPFWYPHFLLLLHFPSHLTVVPMNTHLSLYLPSPMCRASYSDLAPQAAKVVWLLLRAKGMGSVRRPCWPPKAGCWCWGITFKLSLCN